MISDKPFDSQQVNFRADQSISHADDVASKTVESNTPNIVTRTMREYKITKLTSTRRLEIGPKNSTNCIINQEKPENPTKLSCTSSSIEILEQTPIKIKNKIKRGGSITTNTNKKKKNVLKKFTNRSCIAQGMKNNRL